MTMFAGRNIVVLGGSRGIGAAIVRRFARDGGSVTFTFVGSHEAAATLATETGAKALCLDSADRKALVAAIDALAPIDVLIVSAAALVLGDALELDADAVDHMIDVNVRSAYHAAVAAARKMPKGGRIMFIGSAAGSRMPFVGGSAYAMTKSAMQGMVRGLARDLGPRGISVNALQPGPTDTAMAPADGPDAQWVHSLMAIPRHVQPDEVAGYAAYLASPEAAMITGSMQTMDGGFST